MRALLIAAGTGKDSMNLQRVGVHLRGSIYFGDAMVFKTVVVRCPTSPASAFVGFLPITSPPKRAHEYRLLRVLGGSENIHLHCT